MRAKKFDWFEHNPFCFAGWRVLRLTPTPEACGLGGYVLLLALLFILLGRTYMGSRGELVSDPSGAPPVSTISNGSKK